MLNVELFARNVYICISQKLVLMKIIRAILFLLAIVLLSNYQGHAQKVFSCDSKYDADVKIYVVDSKYDADLCVYKVDSKYDADDNKGLWYFVDSKYDADKKIYFVDSKYDADLKIYFVDSKYDAKWMKNEKKHLMY